MSQADFGNPTSPLSGTSLINLIKSWRDALHSSHSGTSRPSYVTSGMTWVDTTTTPFVWKYYDGADDITLGTINASTNIFNPAGYEILDEDTFSSDSATAVPTQQSTKAFVQSAVAGPSFLVTKSASQAISATTVTKVSWQNETFDTNSNFDNATNYRFTPTVAGKYHFTFQFATNACADQQLYQARIHKNGSEAASNLFYASGTNAQTSPPVSVTLDMNGSTDYVEAYVYFGAAASVASTSVNTFFCGSRIA